MRTAARERCGHKRPKQAQKQVGVPREWVPGGSASENNRLRTNESSQSQCVHMGVCIKVISVLGHRTPLHVKSKSLSFELFRD